MKTRHLFLLIIVPLGLLALPAVAWAAVCTGPCIDPLGALTWTVQIVVNNWVIEAMQRLAGLMWFIQRLVGFVLEQLVQADIWTTLRDALFANLRTIVPDVLVDVMGGPNGLFVFAISLGGIAMMFPFMRALKYVHPWDAFTTTVVIATLFVMSTTGYDLIAFLEDVRSQAMLSLAAGNNSDQISVGIGRAMLAQGNETNVSADFGVPGQFRETYFPPVQESEIVTYTVVIFETAGMGWDSQFESRESMAYRQSQAWGGAMVAFLNNIVAFAYAILALILAVLTAGAYVLIFFFVAALPLGVFGFGRGLLTRIMAQYVAVAAVGFLAAATLGTMIALLTNQASDTLVGLVTRLPLIAVLFVMFMLTLTLAWRVTTGSAMLIGTTVSDIGAGAYLGPTPAQLALAATHAVQAEAAQFGQKLNAAAQTAAGAIASDPVVAGKGLLALAQSMTTVPGVTGRAILEREVAASSSRPSNDSFFSSRILL